MKKIVTILMVFTLVLGLAGCKNEETKKETQQDLVEELVEDYIESKKETKAEGEVTEETSAEEVTTEGALVEESTPELEESSKSSETDENTKTDVTEPAKTVTQESTAPKKNQTAETNKTTEKVVENNKTEEEVPVETNETTTPAQTNTSFYNDNNLGYNVDSITINPRHVYWEDGKLVAECFVINGFSHSIYNVDIESFALGNNAGIIASASFGVLDDVVIAPYSYIVWTFVFPADCVFMPNADLSILGCDVQYSNYY